MRLSDERIKLPTALQDCKTICRYLGILDKHEWIDFELNGYPTNKLENWNEQIELIPKYRHVYPVFYNPLGRSIHMAHTLAKVFVMPLDNSILEIIEFKKENMTIQNSQFVDLLNDEKFRSEHNISLNTQIQNAKVSSNQIARIIGGVQNTIYEFLDNLILELEYGQIPENIFEKTRQEVDNKFIQLCPNAIEKLTVVYKQLNDNNEIIYSQIASTCRQIIKDVADSLYPVSKYNSKQKNNSRVLNNEKSINRILAHIESRSERSVFSSMFEYTDNFLHSLQEYASKGDHSKFKKSDAIRCVVYTYILLGDILHYAPIQDD